MVNKSYQKGYRNEHKVELTLEYNGWHVNRNHASKGVEDMVAMKKGKQNMMIQCKDTKQGEKSMSVKELEVFRLHAVEYGAAPIYQYTKNGKSYYKNLDTNEFISFKPITKFWLDQRRKYKKMLKEEKSETRKLDIILKMFKKVKSVICY